MKNYTNRVHWKHLNVNHVACVPFCLQHLRVHHSHFNSFANKPLHLIYRLPSPLPNVVLSIARGLCYTVRNCILAVHRKTVCVHFIHMLETYSR